MTEMESVKKMTFEMLCEEYIKYVLQAYSKGREVDGELLYIGLMERWRARLHDEIENRLETGEYAELKEVLGSLEKHIKLPIGLKSDYSIDEVKSLSKEYGEKLAVFLKKRFSVGEELKC